MDTISKFHHYVPACYLKHFTKEQSRDGTLTVTHVDNGNQRKSTPNRECAENDFNTVEGDCRPDHFEKTMADYENHLAPIWDKCISSQKFPEDGDHFALLIEFVASFRIRNKSQREANERIFTKSMNDKVADSFSSPTQFAEMLKNIETGDLDLSDPDFVEQVRQRALQETPRRTYEFLRNWHISQFGDQIVYLTEQLLEFHWALARMSNASNFVTSDNPLISLRLGFYNKVPSKINDVHRTLIVLPMTPSLAIVGISDWEKGISLPGNEDFVRQINTASLRNAHRYVFGMDDAVSWESAEKRPLGAKDIARSAHLELLRRER